MNCYANQDLQGPVRQKPVNANPGLNFLSIFLFPISYSLLWAGILELTCFFIGKIEEFCKHHKALLMKKLAFEFCLNPGLS